MTTLSIAKAGKSCNWDSRRATPRRAASNLRRHGPSAARGAATGVSAMGYDANKELGKLGPSVPATAMVGSAGSHDRVCFEAEGEAGIELVLTSECDYALESRQRELQEEKMG